MQVHKYQFTVFYPQGKLVAVEVLDETEAMVLTLANELRVYSHAHSDQHTRLNS